MRKDKKSYINCTTRKLKKSIILLFVLLIILSILWSDELSWTFFNDLSYASDNRLTSKYSDIHGGADDIRSILIVDDGFLSATGKGVFSFGYKNGKPQPRRQYTTSDGLPSDNCYLLKMDAKKGVWVACEGGVAHLTNGMKWQVFTDENGLPSNSVNDLLLSDAGKRIWVSTSAGLATKLISDAKWDIFRKNNLLEVFAHPSDDIVWCRRVIPSKCSCGRQILVSEFNLNTKKWFDLPKSQNCPHVSYTPVYYCKNNNLLWLSGGLDPPLVYNFSSRKSNTWDEHPNWEKYAGENEHGQKIVSYSEWFGQIAPFKDNSGRMWFATTAGLWDYSPDADKWQEHPWTKNPGVGQALLRITRSGDKIFWACEDNLTVYDMPNDSWKDLWHIENQSYGRSQSLELSPDDRYIWWLGIGGILVGNCKNMEKVILSDRDMPGLSNSRFVCFDSKHKKTLVATPRGIFCADYSGKATSTLKQSACPIGSPVKHLVFAPDGSEVWCLMGNSGFLRGPHRGRAAIFYPDKGIWSEIPDPSTKRCLHDVMFSVHAKTAWISLSSDDEPKLRVLERVKDDTEWVKMKAAMPKYYSIIEKFWLTPDDNELWMYDGGCGLLRLKQTTGEISQYVKSSFRQHEVEMHYTLSGDYVLDLAFTTDGKYAICSAGGGNDNGITVVDRDSGKAVNYKPTLSQEIEKIVMAPDNKQVWCISNNSHLWAFDLISRKWIHKLSVKNGLPLWYFRSLHVSPDGQYIWIRSPEGAAVYSTLSKKWIAFKGKDWQTERTTNDPLCITGDAKHVILGHTRGIAMIRIDGKSYKILQIAEGVTGCEVSHIVRIPNSNNVLCAISHQKYGGIFHVNIMKKKLQQFKELKFSQVTALDIGPLGHAWAAISNDLICFNPSTGRERQFKND